MEGAYQALYLAKGFLQLPNPGSKSLQTEPLTLANSGLVTGSETPFPFQLPFGFTRKSRAPSYLMDFKNRGEIPVSSFAIAT